MNRLKDIFGQEAVIANLRGRDGGGSAGARADVCRAGGSWKGDVCGGACERFSFANGRNRMMRAESAPVAAPSPPQRIRISTLSPRNWRGLYDKTGTSKATLLPINVIRNAVAEPAGRKIGSGKRKSLHRRASRADDGRGPERTA